MRSGCFEGRDLRLDFFRGFALFSIFVNHVPGNPLGRWTPLNFGFCDSAEVFVLVAGCTAGLVYGRMLGERGLRPTWAKVLGRMGRLYVAHILLMLVFIVLVAYASRLTGNSTYVREMFIGPVLSAPTIVLPMGAILAFQPAFLNILPLYFAVLAIFALGLPVLKRSPSLFLALSVGLYTIVQLTGLTLPTYPSGTWYLNPLAWQLLFAIGAVAAYDPDATRQLLFEKPVVRQSLTIACTLYLVFALILLLTWQVPTVHAFVPDRFRDAIVPHNKSNLEFLRLVYVLALAYLAIVMVGRSSPFLRSVIAKPFILCGRHSLAVFCVGIVLSFLARVIVTELGATATNFWLINVLGLGLLWGLALVLARMSVLRRQGKAAVGSVPAGPVGSAEIEASTTSG